MANTYKDIVITPSRGDANNDPIIKFSTGDATSNLDMNVRFYAISNGTLSFEGTSGQLFSVTNDLTGTLFSVNDISGIPSLEVDANGKVSIAHFGGNVGIGTSNAQFKLDVAGSANVSNDLTVKGNVNIDAGTLFVDATNNRVGIATTVPGFTLEANGTFKFFNYARGNDNGSAYMVGAAIGTTTPVFTFVGSTSTGIASYSPNLGMKFLVNSIERITLANSFVGIGITTPTSNLHVIGTANITGPLIVGTMNIVPTISSVFDKANTANITADAAFGQTNLAFTQANTANTTAVAAFESSNTKFSSSGGTITGDVNIVGTLTISGNTQLQNVTTLSIGDPLIYLAANNYSSDIVDIGFIANYVNANGYNVHTGLYREHEDKQWYLFQGYDTEPANNHIGALSNNMTLAVLNADIKSSNIWLAGSNLSPLLATTFGQANTALSTGQSAYAQANLAFAAANSAVNTFIQLTDTPASYAGYANAFVTVKSDQTGLQFTNNVSISGLQFEAQSPPATPGNNVVEMYLTSTGTSPNKIVELLIKNELGEEITVSRVLA